MSMDRSRPDLIHMAAYLREQLSINKWSVGELNSQLGMDRNSTTSYHWIKGNGAPSPEFVKKLNAVFPNAPPGTFQRKLPVHRKGSTKMITDDTNVVPMLRTIRSNNPLLFQVLPDGNARLQLDISGPLTEMSVLLRMLLDQNELLKK